MKKIYSCCLLMLTSVFTWAQFPVTFSVDMNGQTVSPNGVHIAGNFQDVDYDGTFENPGLINWSPSAYQLSDPDMDGVYSIQLNLVAARYEFKFINGNDWPFEESVPGACQVGGGNSNRELQVNGTTSYSVCWQSCAPCGQKTVRFRVDMSLVTEGVNPVGVSVAGDFQGWNPGATMLSDSDGNLIFERSVNVGSASSVEFKFINGDDWIFAESVPGECGVGPNQNRVVQLTNDNTVLTAYCFGGCSTCLQPTMVTFRVDMTNEVVSPNGVHVAGSFQQPSTWSPGDANYKLEDLDEDNIYELTVAVQPGTIQYKFVNGNSWDDPNESVPSACNVVGNRSALIEGETQELYFCYNQCSSECAANPDPANITFRVNMMEVGASSEGVYFISGATNPAWQAGAVLMEDLDGDGVYECTVMLSGVADIQYKYVNGNVSVSANEENTGLVDCGVDNGIGGYNRVHTRSGEPEILPILCFNKCTNCEGSVGGMQGVVENVRVFPVPAQDVLNIRMTNPHHQQLNMRMVSVTGQTVLIRNAGFVMPGEQTFTLNVEELASGLYFLEISNGTSNQTIRVSVK